MTTRGKVTVDPALRRSIGKIVDACHAAAPSEDDAPAYPPDELDFMDRVMIGIASGCMADPNVKSERDLDLAGMTLHMLEERRKIRGAMVQKAGTEAAQARIAELEERLAKQAPIVKEWLDAIDELCKSWPRGVGYKDNPSHAEWIHDLVTLLGDEKVINER